MKRTFLFPFAFLIAVLFSPLCAQEIMIAGDESSFPFMYKDSSTGKAAGLYAGLLHRIFDDLGIPVNIVPLPWKRALLYSETGVAGVFGLYKNDQRLAVYDFSEPLYEEKIYLYHLGDMLDFQASITALKGRSLGIHTGWSYGNDFDKAKSAGLFSTIEKSNDRELFNLLKSARVDFVLSTAEAAGMLNVGKGEYSTIAVHPQPLITNSAYLCFNKNSNMAALLRDFNKHLALMKGNGSYDVLISGMLSNEKELSQ